jgi:hypothetical protein
MKPFEGSVFGSPSYIIPRDGFARREKREEFFARMHGELETQLRTYWDALPPIAETAMQREYVLWAWCYQKGMSAPKIQKQYALEYSLAAVIKGIDKGCQILGEKKRPSKTRPSRKK